MQEPIDFTGKDLYERNYLKKSTTVFKIYGIAVALFIVMFLIVASFMDYSNAPVMIMFMCSPIVTIALVAPTGLYYSIKSQVRKEGTARKRVLHIFGHAVCCLLITLYIGILVHDISEFLI